MSDTPRTDDNAVHVDDIIGASEFYVPKEVSANLERELNHLNERLIAQHEGDLTERESYWAAETLKARAELSALKAENYELQSAMPQPCCGDYQECTNERCVPRLKAKLTKCEKDAYIDAAMYPEAPK